MRGQPVRPLGLRRARAATALMPAPPGARVLAASEPVTTHVPIDATVWFTTEEA
ncbi:hypothetical protein [Streptomyces ortus]|uniref:Uncharacterized protein n=1 Tax=Streptomyces ortus TaxID=2867268 RepID=A0ABT3V7M2_9ACTN|nr:hypothetical protein [Streptomyces ortus]MCX4234919.1 hypothetical protein [Streptomyces ortus]